MATTKKIHTKTWKFDKDDGVRVVRADSPFWSWVGKVTQQLDIMDGYRHYAVEFSIPVKGSDLRVIFREDSDLRATFRATFREDFLAFASVVQEI